MEIGSPSIQVKRLEAEIRLILRGVDTAKLPAKQRAILAEIQQDLIDARKYASGYELSETRTEQLDNAKTATKWLNKVQKCILSASEHDIFSAIDVASLSAQIETLKEVLK